MFMVFRFIFCGKWKGWWHLGDNVSEAGTQKEMEVFQRTRRKNPAGVGAAPGQIRGSLDT